MASPSRTRSAGISAGKLFAISIIERAAPRQRGETAKVDERTVEIIRVMITRAGENAIEGRTP